MKLGTVLTLLYASLIGGVFPSQAVAQLVSCSAQGTFSSQMRAEGLTELTGDIIITCVGGIPTAAGAPLPTGDLTVLFSAPVTNRLYANGWSDALLIIDEPPHTMPQFPGDVAPNSTQLACADPNGICTITGTGTGLGTYDGAAGRPNIFLGRAGGNSVIFPSVPFDPPGASGQRTLRITNIRVNVTGFPPPPGTNPVQAFVMVGGGLFALSNAQPTVGFVSPSADFSLRLPDNSGVADSGGFAVSQCGAPQRVAVFRAAELFGTAFKRRAVQPAFVDSDTSPAPAVQNVVGVLYNSESAFYNPALTAPTVDFATVGLADAGTRVRAVIGNIPNGSKVFVATQYVNGVSGTLEHAVARLVQNETGAFAPMAATATLEGVPVAELSVVNGSATAVWEVLDTNPNNAENFDFPIWVQSGTTAGSASLTGSYAPASPAFDVVGGNFASSTLPIPRFVSIAGALPLFNTTSACTLASSTSTALTATYVAPNQYRLTATVTTPTPAAWGTPTGTVAFYDNGAAIAGSTTSVTAAGTATFNAVLLGGAHSLTAIFTPSDAQHFTASTSAAVSLTVPAAATSTALAATPSGVTHQYSLTATVTTPAPAVTGAPGGTVTFYDSGIAIAGSTTSLAAGGTASFLAVLVPGGHTLTAVFTPSNNQLFAASTSGGVSLSIERVAANIKIASNLNPSLPGQAVTFTATVMGGGAPLNGTVQFADGSQALGSASLAGGSASVTATLATVGVHDIFATYSGDAANGDATARFGQRVDRVTGSLTLAVSAAAAGFGQTVTFTATLVSQAPAGVPAATGTVQFREGSTTIGSAALVSGAATLAVSNLAAGTHQILALYGGDASWYGTHSSAVTVSVSLSATTAVLTSSATMTEVRLSATLTPAAGGSIDFRDSAGNTVLGTAPLENGTATLALTPADAAKIAGHPIIAVYSGSGGFAGCSSNTLLLPGIGNAAGGPSTQVAPEELVSVYGSNLAVEITQAATVVTLPQTLGGLSVSVTDATGAVMACGLYYASPSQVNFLMPPGLAPGAALVTVMRAGAVVAAVPLTVARVAPGIFGTAQVLRPEGGAVYLVLYGTGIRNASAISAVTCTVNGTPLPVMYAGAQADFPGLDQVNVLLPADLRGAGTLSVSLTVDGQGSNTVTVPMQ